MGKIPWLEDHTTCEVLIGLKLFGQGGIQWMEGGTAIFEDDKNKFEVEGATDVGRSWLEQPMDKPDDFTSFLTDGVNIKVPGELICKPHIKKFGWMHTIDRQTIENDGEIREWILHGGYNHHFRFGSIEVVIGKPCIDDDDVWLKFG